MAMGETSRRRLSALLLGLSALCAVGLRVPIAKAGGHACCGERPPASSAVQPCEGFGAAVCCHSTALPPASRHGALPAAPVAPAGPPPTLDLVATASRWRADASPAPALSPHRLSVVLRL